jgi:DNA-binding MarR family transcriptional regulator
VADANAGSAGAPESRPAAALDDRRLARLTGYNVARTNLRMMRAFQVHVGEVGLKPAEYSALVLIASNPGINQKQLGDALDISPPNLAVMLDQLCHRSLLERVRSAVDRRLQHPQLTADGKALLAEAERRASVMEDKILDALTPGERGILLELLQKLSG